MSGNVDPNLGPAATAELLQIMGERECAPDFQIPDIKLFPHKIFDFESFYIHPQARQIVKERCFNIIYSCSAAHAKLNNCFKVFTKFYIKNSVPISNIVTTTINECRIGYRCAFCLQASNGYNVAFFPKGFVCSYVCEEHYMNKFILPYNKSEHRCRAQGVKHIGLRSMNNFGRFPNCKDHFSFKICLMDTVDRDCIKS